MHYSTSWAAEASPHKSLNKRPQPASSLFTSVSRAPLAQAATQARSSEDSSAAALAVELQAALAAAERNAAEVRRLRGELAHLQRMMQVG